MTTPRPDPDRLGGISWLERTRGALTRAEKRALLGIIARTQGRNIAGRLRLASGRVPDRIAGIDEALLAPPDSALAREAEEACREQPAALIGHGHRTWAYGRALATIDRIPIDDELYYVASLLHDAGLVDTVTGEDFTLRSGHRHHHRPDPRRSPRRARRPIRAAGPMWFHPGDQSRATSSLTFASDRFQADRASQAPPSTMTTITTAVIP